MPGALAVMPGALAVMPGALVVMYDVPAVVPGALAVMPGSQVVMPGALVVMAMALNMGPSTLVRIMLDIRPAIVSAIHSSVCRIKGSVAPSYSVYLSSLCVGHYFLLFRS